MEKRADVFEASRSWLFAIAYRMLGGVADAEDVVQDAWLRWQEAPDAEVRSPRAYLTPIVTRLAINRLQSARSRRETYVGTWLPEPLVTESAPDAQEHLELADSVSMAFLVLLERLTPVERAVFLLREVFDLDYDEIARIVEKTEANCRQLFARAKQHLGSGEARFTADPAQASRLVSRFAATGSRPSMPSPTRTSWGSSRRWRSATLYGRVPAREALSAAASFSAAPSPIPK